LPCCLCGRRQQDRCRRRRAAELMITGGEKHTAAAAHSARDHWRPPSTREHAAGCQPGRRPPAHTLLAGIHRQQLVAGGKSKQAGGRSAKAGRQARRHDGEGLESCCWLPACWDCAKSAKAGSQPAYNCSGGAPGAAAGLAAHDGAAMALRAICDPRPFYTAVRSIGNVRNVVLCNVTTEKRWAACCQLSEHVHVLFSSTCSCSCSCWLVHTCSCSCSALLASTYMFMFLFMFMF
jgi:hypothetical protein